MSRSHTTLVNPDLDALGTYTDTLYYLVDDVKVEEVQSDNRVGRYVRTLSSLTFGSTSSITIPNFDFLSSTYLQVTIPEIPSGITLPDAALFQMIESISYSWGTSNMSNVIISGQDLLHHNYMDCENKEKRNRMIHLSGPQHAVDLINPLPPQTAAILLKFPWSNMSADMDKRAFDTRLLDTNLLLEVKFHPKEKIFGWGLGFSTLVPTALLSAKIILKQTELTDHSDSLAVRMKKTPEMIYNYPFVNIMTGSFSRYTPAATGINTVSLEVTKFLNSDLLGILFSIVRVKDTTRTSDIAFAHPNPFRLLPVTNVRLTYNGQVQSEYLDSLLDLATLNISKGDPTCDLHQLNGTSGVAVADPLELSYVHYIPFTQHKTLTYSGKYNNTSRYKGQPMDLQFDYNSTDTEQILVRTTYLYNAFCSVKDQGSTLHLG